MSWNSELFNSELFAKQALDFFIDNPSTLGTLREVLNEDLSEEKIKDIIVRVRKFHDLPIQAIFDEVAGYESRFTLGSYKAQRHVGKALSPIAEVAGDDDELFLRFLSMAFKKVQGAYISMQKEIVLSTLWAVRWAQAAFPTLHLTGEQIAAFAFSNISEEQLEDWRTPWTAFRIPIPKGVLDTETHEVTDICFIESNFISGKIKKGFTVRIDVIDKLKNHKMYLWRTENSVGGLRKQTVEISWFSQDLEDEGKVCIEKDEERIIYISALVILNSCFAALEKNALYIPKTGRGFRNKKKLRDKIYKLRTPIIIDARKYLSSCLKGESGRKYTARWLVRGHWRNQPVGKEKKDIRRIFIEPFWKGPERGTVLNRDYVIEPKE